MVEEVRKELEATVLQSNNSNMFQIPWVYPITSNSGFFALVKALFKILLQVIGQTDRPNKFLSSLENCCGQLCRCLRLSV